jgi:hypothetical protein
MLIVDAGLFRKVDFTLGLARTDFSHRLDG